MYRLYLTNFYVKLTRGGLRVLWIRDLSIIDFIDYISINFINYVSIIYRLSIDCT